MTFYLSLRSELLKTKGTASLYLTLGIAALIPFLLFVDYSGDIPSLDSLGKHPLNHYLAKGHEILSVMFMPMFTVLACTLLPQLEYRSNTWKQVLASPQPLRNVFFSKLLIIHLLILTLILLHNGFMLLSALGIQFFTPTFNLFKGGMDWNTWLLTNFKIYMAILPISIVQFWLGLRVRNFIMPIGIGLALWITSTLLAFEVKWKHADLFPFGYPQMMLMPQYKDASSFLQISAGVYTLFFLLMAFADFNGRRVKA